MRAGGTRAVASCALGQQRQEEGSVDSASWRGWLRAERVLGQKGQGSK